MSITPANDDNPSKLVDMFGFSEEEYKENKFHWGRPLFQREATFEEDISSLMRKWKGHKNEVLLYHMRDSLKIFLHNKREYDRYFGSKS